MAKEKTPEQTDVKDNGRRKAVVNPTPLQQFEIYRKLLRGDASFQWFFSNLELRKCNPIIIE